MNVFDVAAGRFLLPAGAASVDLAGCVTDALGFCYTKPFAAVALAAGARCAAAGGAGVGTSGSLDSFRKVDTLTTWIIFGHLWQLRRARYERW